MNTSPTPPCEISWFGALCDDDYEFLGVPDPRLASSWAHCRGIVERAEAGGFDNILLPSGYTLGIDTTAFAAAMAAVTERIRLTTSIAIVPYRNTAMFAKEAASVDVLSGGRLTLGLAPGIRRAHRSLDLVEALDAHLRGHDHGAQLLGAAGRLPLRLVLLV